MPLDKLLNHPKAGTALTGALSGAAGGALVSAFTNKKSAKKLLKGAGLVAVGGLAWQAYQSYRSGGAGSDTAATASSPVAPGADQLTRQQFEAVVAPQADSSALLVLQAMIAAAHADGHLTSAEQENVWQQALSMNLPAQELNTLQTHISQPLTVDALSAACGDMATKIEVYTASVLTLDEQCAAGQAHLQRLAGALALPAPLVATLHQKCEAAPPVTALNATA